MSYYDDRGTTMGGFLRNSTKEAFGEFIAFMLGAVLVIAVLLGVGYSVKTLFFTGPVCIKHHQQVEQVDSYGKKEAVTVCDQYKNEPVTEPAK
jgi:hypothetical protein